MSFNSLLIHTVTIRHPETSGTDRYGNDTLVLSAGFTSKARVDMIAIGGGSREELLDRDTRETWANIFLPPNTDVDGLSVIEWDGHTFAVHGPPSLIFDGVKQHHIEVLAREVEG